MRLSRKDKRKPNKMFIRHKRVYAKWVSKDGIEALYVFRNRSIETVERYLKITNAKEVIYIVNERPVDVNKDADLEMYRSLLQYFYQRYTEKGVLKTGSF